MPLSRNKLETANSASKWITLNVGVWVRFFCYSVFHNSCIYPRKRSDHLIVDVVCRVGPSITPLVAPQAHESVGPPRPLLDDNRCIPSFGTILWTGVCLSRDRRLSPVNVTPHKSNKLNNNGQSENWLRLKCLQYESEFNENPFSSGNIHQERCWRRWAESDSEVTALRWAIIVCVCTCVWQRDTTEVNY